MMTFFYICLALLGLVLGSFYNVVGLRLPKGESIISPPSHCPSCENRLRPIELIPVFSYIIQRGRCKHCQTKISPRYAFFELLTAFLFVLSFYYIGFELELIIALLFMSLCIIITISDIHYQIISNKVLIFFAVVIGVLRLIIPLEPWYDAYVGAAFGFGLLLLIAILSKGGMGGGDVKLFGVIGLALGFQGTLLTFVLASILGAVIGLFLMIIKKVKRDTPIAFGPFIATAAVIAYIYGDKILSWYGQSVLF